jgi:MSHA biogenesis protein MshI
MFGWKRTQNSIDTKKPGLIGISILEKEVSVAYVIKEHKTVLLKHYQYAAAETVEEQKNVLTEFVKKYNLSGVDCNYVLNHTDYAIGLIDLATDKDLGELIDTQKAVKELINYPTTDAVINFFELPIPRANDNKPVGYIVAMHKSLVTKIEQTVDNLSLNLIFIDIPEMVLRNIAILHPENKTGMLFFHLTTKGGNILLIRKDALYVARKINLQLDKITTENNELLDRLSIDIQRSMDYCTSLFRYSPANSILLSPPPSTINAELVQAYLKANLGIEVQTMDLANLLKSESTITQQQQAKCMLSIGAALRGYVGV